MKLEGLRVVDLSMFLPGPHLTMMMADHGAEVIKVEPPGEGDPHRHNYKNAGYPQSDRNFPWQLDGRLKRSIALDLKNPQGRQLLRRIVEALDVDVFCCNTIPVRYKQLGIDYEQLAAIKPDLIWAGISAMGPPLITDRAPAPVISLA